MPIGEIQPKCMSFCVEPFLHIHTYIYRITSYLRLVVLAVGFQHSAKLGFSRESELVLQSIKAAREVIRIMVERLYPTGNLRFAMEASFLYVAFAAAFLINVSLLNLSKYYIIKMAIAFAPQIPPPT